MGFDFASSFNRFGKFEYDTTDFAYKKLVDLYKEFGPDCVYPVTSVHVNTKSKFGDSPVVSTLDCHVNLPSHLLDTINSILTNSDAIDSINRGRVGFKIYEYVQSTYNRTCYSIKWVNISSDGEVSV